MASHSPRHLEHEPCSPHERAAAFLSAGAATMMMMAVVMFATGCNGKFPGQPELADRPIPEDKVLSFDDLFRRNCSGCHGADGRLGPAPPLNDAIFLAIVPDADLLQVIQAGRRGTPMPAFVRDRGGSLTDAQVNAIATGIKERWQPVAANSIANLTSNPTAISADALPSYHLAKDADESFEASPGREDAMSIFAQSCAGCHGAHGQQGTGKTRAGAIDDPAFLSLISDQALRRIIITGRPDFKMPTFEGVNGRSPDFVPLTSSQINALVSLLAQWRRGEEPGAPPP